MRESREKNNAKRGRSIIEGQSLREREREIMRKRNIETNKQIGRDTMRMRNR